jgi:hypothetical protein
MAHSYHLLRFSIIHSLMCYRWNNHTSNYKTCIHKILNLLWFTSQRTFVPWCGHQSLVAPFPLWCRSMHEIWHNNFGATSLALKLLCTSHIMTTFHGSQAICVFLKLWPIFSSPFKFRATSKRNMKHHISIKMGTPRKPKRWNSWYKKKWSRLESIPFYWALCCLRNPPPPQWLMEPYVLLPNPISSKNRKNIFTQRKQLGFKSFQTSWSLLGPGVEVGLTPNCMKGIHIFPFLIVGSFFIYFSTK